jgi:lipopolysaccharide export system protein LptA
LKHSVKYLYLILLSYSGGPASAQVPKKIEWSANYVEYVENMANGAYRLIDNVRFQHEGALMFCDSAYFYSATNSLDAFSRVHIIQGDTVDLYGSFLHYDGNTRIAKIRKNVKLVGKNTLLTTSELEFNLGNNIGYYTKHADIESGENRLKSRQGYYYSKEQKYYFRDSVVLTNPDYVIYSDTLQYETPTSIAYFFGPTEIVGDSSYIYCENGWYNTATNKSTLRVKALVKNNNQTIRGDTLYYERETGYGEGYSNIEVVDEEQDIILKGNYAIINQKEDRALLTDHAVFIYITDNDSVFIHADTLRALPDSAGNRQLRAFYNVRLYKSDLQGICDSLSYSAADSILRLYRQPVLWSGINQLSSEYMEIWTRNRQIDQLHMQGEAFIINQQDSGKYNQVKGKSMIWYFRENEPYKIMARGNGQTVYYSQEDNNLMVNVAQCSDITIAIREKKIDNITMLIKPTAILYPYALAPKEQLTLKNFKWIESSRPKERNDIFSKD